ncbi:hypothetical protein MUK42_18304 [Musa troglodytarum]|uniref:Uncharacterized protein n=1 Tax=Musa troglodytarum TaxID=320322 RepID=A0A9E7ETI8_9LILI|nr:hypothetical protein MUK42_18304 [Musa troglodytarum]
MNLINLKLFSFTSFWRALRLLIITLLVFHLLTDSGSLRSSPYLKTTTILVPHQLLDSVKEQREYRLAKVRDYDVISPSAWPNLDSPAWSIPYR